MKGRVNPDFWRHRRVLLTGHTGFKGSWCSLWLQRMGAVVTGYSLAPYINPNLFEGAEAWRGIDSRLGDLCNATALARCIADSDPEIVIHMAAQSLVRKALIDPIETFTTNVSGTVHLLDALRHAPSLQAVLVVTTDKVYRNSGGGIPFRESDPLGGSEPYGASKAAVEIATGAMSSSYFAARGVPVATARGGNVIGGGDYAPDRIVPDVVKAVFRGEPVLLRYPDSTRPWQHVLDCLAGYLVFVQTLVEGRPVPSALNIGPGPGPAVSVGQLVDALLEALGAKTGWQHDRSAHPPEAPLLALDTSLAREILEWREYWPGPSAISATASWFRSVGRGASIREVTIEQIDAYAIASACP